MNDNETMETWKQMVRSFAKQLMKEDSEFKNRFKEFEHSKYVMEAMVRPFFGDDEDAYDFWLECINGANVL
jgi:hypothetical protein